MHVDLQIDELVLDGINVEDREGLRAAVSAELTRLMAERGVPPTLGRAGEVPSLTANPITVEPGASANLIGGQIARAVYGGLGGE